MTTPVSPAAYGVIAITSNAEMLMVPPCFFDRINCPHFFCNLYPFHKRNRFANRATP